MFEFAGSGICRPEFITTELLLVRYMIHLHEFIYLN